MVRKEPVHEEPVHEEPVHEEPVYEESICPICLEDYATDKDKPIQKLDCNHRVHLNCIKEWVRKNPYQVFCPLCKKTITIKSIVNIANEAKLTARNTVSSSAVLAGRNHLTPVPITRADARANYERHRANLDRHREPSSLSRG